MSTKTLTSSAFCLSKVILALALVLGMGLQSVSAAALSSAEAKTYAKWLSSAQSYNNAFQIARDFTANSGPEFAVYNARLVAGQMNGNVIGLAALINGLSYNYPGQQAAIVAQVILLNEKNRDNAAKIIALVGPSLSNDAATQVAAFLNVTIAKNRDTRKSAAIIAYSLFTAVASNSSSSSAADLAAVAFNLSFSLLVPDKHGVVSKANLKAYAQIASVFSAFIQSADTGGLTREEYVNNAVGYYVKSIQTAASSGAISQTQIVTTLNRTRAILTSTMPQYSSIINTVVQDVIDTGDFGEITPSETPH